MYFPDTPYTHLVCLRHWEYQRASNREVWQITEQPPLTSII